MNVRINILVKGMSLLSREQCVASGREEREKWLYAFQTLFSNTHNEKPTTK